MKITIYFTGKTSEKCYEEVIHDYLKRINRYVCTTIIVLPDIKDTSKKTSGFLPEKEGDMLLKRLSASDELYLLDERGSQYSSVDFAGFLNNKMVASTKSMVFLIGGAYGFSNPVYERANGMMSLSKMTFSHQLVRLIFLEQLYRAFTILRNEPYHHT